MKSSDQIFFGEGGSLPVEVACRGWHRQERVPWRLSVCPLPHPVELELPGGRVGPAAAPPSTPAALLSLIYNQCCRPGMFIPDPGSWFLPIPDPGSRISDPGSKNSNKREGRKKNSCHTFFIAINLTKIVNYFIFEMLNKQIWANFQIIIEFLPKQSSLALKNMGLGSGIRDPGSGKNLFRTPNPGSRGQKGTESRIRIRNTARKAGSKPVHRFGTGTVQTFINLILLQETNRMYILFLSKVCVKLFTIS